MKSSIKPSLKFCVFISIQLSTLWPILMTNRTVEIYSSWCIIMLRTDSQILLSLQTLCEVHRSQTLGMLNDIIGHLLLIQVTWESLIELNIYWTWRLINSILIRNISATIPISFLLRITPHWCFIRHIHVLSHIHLSFNMHVWCHWLSWNVIHNFRLQGLPFIDKWSLLNFYVRPIVK